MTHSSSSRSVAPDPHALSALAWKYRTLAALRRARAEGEAPPGREVFRSLAQKFPGALRELDTVYLADLDARAEALEQAAQDHPGRLEPWMAWQHGYHVWMRTALYLKARLGRERARGELAPEVLERLAVDAGARAGFAVDLDFVRSIVTLPGGRMRPVVIARVAREHGSDEREIHGALFPPRTPGPDRSAVTGP